MKKVQVANFIVTIGNYNLLNHHIMYIHLHILFLPRRDSRTSTSELNLLHHL